MKLESAWWEVLHDLHRQRRSHVLVTVVALRGSYPQQVGAKILVDDHGLVAGTVGGGAVELRAIEHARKILVEKLPCHQLVWNLQVDLAMSCGGEVTLLFEPFHLQSSWEIAIFGAGHVAQKLIPLLAQIDCHVTWIDNRQEWLDKTLVGSNVTKKLVPKMEEEVDLLSPGTFIVSVSIGHIQDFPIALRALQCARFPYIGIIGSKVKSQKLKTQLSDSGISTEAISAIHCPIGEPLGTNQPMEVAISILAQLLKERDRLQCI